MKELVVYDGPRVEAIESPIPDPGPGQICVRVMVVASNPKDWKYYLFNKPLNQGEDMAGYVHTVGEGVSEFKPGDRVFAEHKTGAPHGAYAEYALAEANTTSHLPKQVSFHEGATIPVAALTAALGLYQNLSLPQPWVPAIDQMPLLVYGGSTACGAFAIKLACASGIHPIVAVAGRGCDYVRTLVDASKGDVVLDYRAGPEELQQAMVTAMKQYLPAGETGSQGLFTHAFDTVAEPETVAFCARVVRANGTFVHIMPLPDGDAFKSDFRQNVKFDIPISGDVFEAFRPAPKGRIFGHVFMRAFARGLEEGWFSGHPYEIITGGLNGVQEGLDRLKAGKVSASKLVYEVAIA